MPMRMVQNRTTPNTGVERERPGHSLVNGVTATEYCSFAISQENELILTM